jgi:crossover junction endodeoxyribonuclease RuvC
MEDKHMSEHMNGGRGNFLGIDPGQTGALAVVNEREVLFVGDLPVHQLRVGKKTRTELDLGGLCELLAKLTDPQTYKAEHAFIEGVAARPGQGVTSMFRFGFCAGAIVGVVTALRLPHSLILPQRWQKLAGCGPSPDAARRRAGQLYPNATSFLTRKRDAGRADAILIAHAGLSPTPPPNGNHNREA